MDSSNQSKPTQRLQRTRLARRTLYFFNLFCKAVKFHHVEKLFKLSNKLNRRTQLDTVLFLFSGNMTNRFHQEVDKISQ